MTPQEIFDKAYLGLKAQGRQSKSKGEACAYRGHQGACCGVGFLVTDATAMAWDKRSDASIYSILRDDAREGKGPIEGVEDWMRKNPELLEHIQDAHDGAREWGSEVFGFEAKFARVAAKFNLTVPQVTE